MNAATREVLSKLTEMVGPIDWGLRHGGHSEQRDDGRYYQVAAVVATVEDYVRLEDNDESYLFVEVGHLDHRGSTTDSESAIFTPGMDAGAIASFLQTLLTDIGVVS